MPIQSNMHLLRGGVITVPDRWTKPIESIWKDERPGRYRIKFDDTVIYLETPSLYEPSRIPDTLIPGNLYIRRGDVMTIPDVGAFEVGAISWVALNRYRVRLDAKSEPSVVLVIENSHLAWRDLGR
ncbi:hypothetical protein G3T36_02150 [Diaminobutyricibacter tongyongensis]|uniref:Uncharacterized protein n=1 Tax=Leifsonia tongyongensis TaxID=1268043 RepID=A0A6L9XTG9_9MICO|nr:hypothetical protein [Diaminobutyricibacter tongyongensis]NEN04663.1 hypothetical protein [Diaminobutyricibacter tongyongensis]